MCRTTIYAATMLFAIVVLPLGLANAEDDATGRSLQQSMIWLDSAPFGKEVYAVFRKQLPLATTPEKATLHIFADTRYMLWINGQYVERGPCRFFPTHPTYDTLDVTPYLCQGENALAVVVHHYHDGVMQNCRDKDVSEVNGRVARHVPGLTASLDIVELGGHRTSLSTDASWRGSTKNRFEPSGVSISSIPDRIDARRDSGDWTLSGFDDSSWEKPVAVDGEQWGPLCARDIPRLRETEVKPLTLIEHTGKAMRQPLVESLPIDMKPGDYVVIDAGQFVQAYSIVDLEAAQEGSNLAIEYVQTFFDTDRKPDGTDTDRRSNGQLKHIDRYIARDGSQTYMSGDTFGCKYVVVRLKSGEVRLKGVRLINRLYPFDVVGRFQSNDKYLNHLWQIGINTVRILCEDAYVDSASRERAQWLGDGVVVEAPISRIAFVGPGEDGRPRYADPRLLRQKVRQIGQTVLPDGRVKAFSPSDGFDKHGFIEDYACLWIQGIRSYTDISDEIDVARELWPIVTGQLKWFLDRLAPNGLVHAREFVDSRNPLVYQVCEGATLNAYLYRSLADAAELARRLDKPEQQQQYQAAAKALKASINEHLWNDEAGCYYGAIQNGKNSAPTVYAAMMCLYFDVVPPERKDRVNQWLLANYAKDALGPYAHMYLFEVLYRMDTAAADQLVLDLMRERWAEMAKGETQTVWEGFHRNEYCHNWGSAPTYFLSKHVLGVEVDGPVSDRRILIEPRLGDLGRVEGTVVTEFGPVPVLWEKTDDGKKLAFQVQVPDNVTAKLHLPTIGSAPIVVINGEPTKSSEHGRFLALEIGPGKHVGYVQRGVTAGLPYLNPVEMKVEKDRIGLESDSGFRLDNCRPVLYWRLKGKPDWVESKAGEFQNMELSQGGRSFAVTFDQLRAEVGIRKFMGDQVWRFSGRLTNQGKEPVELARFHYLDGIVPGGLKFLELMGPREQPELRSGQAEVAVRADVEQLWKSMGVTWPRLAEPIHDQAGWFVSTDIAALVETWNTPGWGFGFVGPGNAFGQIGYRGSPSGSRFFVGVLLDNIVLDPGETFTLEEPIVWCGDWQSGLDAWARTCADECGARKSATPLVGYCSWYQKTSRIAADDIDRATREFASWPVPPGGRTIQIDDGFQVQPGNWDPNDKFKEAWPDLTQRIAATGAVPGLWLAPTTVHEKNPIVNEHPDWLQRLPNGEPAISFRNWGRTYYLEPDHPEVRSFMRGLFRRFCDEGWKYFKIDFTYPVTPAREAYDRKKTEFQTLRDMYALFREAVGPNILLNACVGMPCRYALGHVDVARLGGDVGFNYPGVQTAVRQLLTRTATNGVWWQGDPDVFAMRSENVNLSAEEKRILTGTIGLFGGLFLTSDYPTQWSEDEAAFVRQFWNEKAPRPPRHQYVVWDADGQIAAYRVSYDDGRLPHHRLAIYNWSDEARDVCVRLSDAHIEDTTLLQLAPDSVAEGVTLNDGAIAMPNQPAHSLRIVSLVEQK